MILLRSLLCAAIAGGIAFAAGQHSSTADPATQLFQPAATPSTLPPAMASAIDRLAKPGVSNPPPPGPVRQWFSLPAPGIKVAQAPNAVQACSIPLAESTVPISPKFFIRDAPQPKNSKDAMPIIKAPVCGSGNAR